MCEYRNSMGIVYSSFSASQDVWSDLNGQLMRTQVITGSLLSQCQSASSEQWHERLWKQDAYCLGPSGLMNSTIELRMSGLALLSCRCLAQWWWTNLVDPASSHMLVSKIKPCMCKYKHLYCETANGSLNQLSFIWLYSLQNYMDICGNSRANTCEKFRLFGEGMYLLD